MKLNAQEKDDLYDERKAELLERRIRETISGDCPVCDALPDHVDFFDGGVEHHSWRCGCKIRWTRDKSLEVINGCPQKLQQTLDHEAEDAEEVAAKEADLFVREMADEPDDPLYDDHETPDDEHECDIGDGDGDDDL